MKGYLKLLSAAVSAAFLGSQSAANPTDEITLSSLEEGSFGNLPVKRMLNTDVPLHLAAHSSHSSHGSHGSHRSSAGSSAAPVPSYPSTPRPAPRADPLGQPPKPKETYKPKIPDAEKLRNDKDLREKVVQKVQMVLFLSGEYTGKITGVLDAETRDAVDLYKIKRGILRGGYLDRDTLNELGVSIY